jgi:hypothetical protein
MQERSLLGSTSLEAQVAAETTKVFFVVPMLQRLLIARGTKSDEDSN